MKALILEELLLPELEAALSGVELALVPVGSCEQHGPNSTYATDTARAASFARMLGERMGEQLLICPAVPYGISNHHIMFAGTVTLRGETYIRLLEDIAISLSKHGIRRVVYLNGHGGNTPSLGVTINALKYEYGIDAYYVGMGEGTFGDSVDPALGWSVKRGHASESETSQAMALCPQVVAKELKKGEVVDDFVIRGPGAPFKYGGCAWDWKKDASANGALGDARKASLKEGVRLNNIALDRVEAMLRYIIEKR